MSASGESPVNLPKGQVSVPTDMPTDDGDQGWRDASTLTSVVVGVVVLVALYVGRDVLVPITLAILLSFVLAPVVRLLRHLRVGRVPAVFVAVLLALAVILSLGGVIGVQISQLVPGIPTYVSTINQKVANVRTMVTEQFSGIVGSLGHQVDRAAPTPAKTTGGKPPPVVADAGKPLPVEVRQPDPTAFEIAERIMAPVASPLATAGIVFTVTIFILLQQTDLRDRFIRLSGLRDLHRTTRALDDAARRLSRYLLTQLGLNATFGVVIGLGLLLIGVPNPLLWGTLAMLFRFVPYVGSAVSGLLPTALAAAVDPGWSMAIYSAALFLVTELVMGQFIDPLAYGKSTGLSSVAVVISAIFWAWMWGPIGLILSVPLTLCLVVLGRHIKRLEFLDVLMGDRPALTPVESFYQRILANDPDEALEYAEALLRDRSLSTYYDEVAIKGLQLTANDVERGVLNPPLLARIQRAMSRLVDELDIFEDVSPTSAKPRAHRTSGVEAPEAMSEVENESPEPAGPVEGQLTGVWSGAAPVLCIAGGGPLDQSVTDMLAQLLTKNGFGVSAVPFAAASRASIGALDVSGVAMVCICYLDISLSPSQLRYLVRRVRQIAPHVPILAGLWSEDGALLVDERLRAAVGADRYADSLREAVNICLELAEPFRLATPTTDDAANSALANPAIA